MTTAEINAIACPTCGRYGSRYLVPGAPGRVRCGACGAHVVSGYLGATRLSSLASPSSYPSVLENPFTARAGTRSPD